jgi:hypothetical protein
MPLTKHLLPFEARPCQDLTCTRGPCRSCHSSQWHGDLMGLLHICALRNRKSKPYVGMSDVD